MPRMSGVKRAATDFFRVLDNLSRNRRIFFRRWRCAESERCGTYTGSAWTWQLLQVRPARGCADTARITAP
jgi:hypothetical protein